jgi:hypothetical protein
MLLLLLLLLWLFLVVGAAATPCTDEQCAICGFRSGVCNTIASTCAVLTEASFCEIYTCDVGACSTDLIDTCQYDNCPVPQCTDNQCTILAQACDNGCDTGKIGDVCPAVADCLADIISTGICTANASAPNGASCDLTTTSFTCNASACNILPPPPACTDEQCATIAGAVTACDDSTVDDVCVYVYGTLCTFGVCTAESTCNVDGGVQCNINSCPPPPTPPPPPPPPSCAPFSCRSANNSNTKQPCTQSTDCVDTSGCGAAGACFGSVCVFAQQPCGFAYCTEMAQFNFTDFYCYYNGVNLTAPYAPICSKRADYCDPSLADCSCPSPPPTCPSQAPLCSVADDTCAARFNQTAGTACFVPASGGGGGGHGDGVCSGAPILDGYDAAYRGYPCVTDLSALGTGEEAGTNFCNVVTGQPIYDCTNMCGVGVVNSNPYLIGPNYACFPQYVYQCDCIPPPPPPPTPPSTPTPSGGGGGTLSWLPVEIMLPLAGGLVLLAAALLLATRSRGIARRGGRRRRNSATGASIRL